MKRQFVIFGVIILLVGVMLGSNVWATNITIFDTYVSGDPGTQYNQGNNPGEVGEVEPGMSGPDLQSFQFSGNSLTMTGTFDFNLGYQGFKSGDIFVATQGTPLYGETAPIANGLNIYGYDYALRMTFGQGGTGTYQVYAIDEDTAVQATLYGANFRSNPLRLASPGDPVLPLGGDLEFGAVDGVYFVNLLNISGSLRDKDTYYHFTMDCGNDFMMGKIPLPSTVLLLGSGLVGLAAMGWRRRKA